MTRRFVLAFLALTVFVLLVLVVPLGISASNRERDRLTLDLERDARVIGSFAEDTLEGLADEDLQAVAEDYADRTGARVVIVNARGRVLTDSDPVEGAGNYRDRPEIPRTSRRRQPRVARSPRSGARRDGRATRVRWARRELRGPRRRQPRVLGRAAVATRRPAPAARHPDAHRVVTHGKPSIA